MIVYVPDYYPEFRCAAGNCGHTCCEGWEIDIDPDTLKKYEQMDGELGEKLKKSISLSPEPHFLLSSGERCPFLTENRLCQLILEKGEDALCQICADHPRFRNYWSDRIEMGLGMACEEAARLILSSPHPMRLIPWGEDPNETEEAPSPQEQELLLFRNQLLFSVPGQGPAARLREYLIYRHLADSLYDGRMKERLRLIDQAAARILEGWDGSSFPCLVERARAFSNEIEYDDEKLLRLMEEDASFPMEIK